MDISYGYILCGKYNIILEILNILFDKNNILTVDFALSLFENQLDSVNLYIPL